MASLAGIPAKTAICQPSNYVVAPSMAADRAKRAAALELPTGCKKKVWKISSKCRGACTQNCGAMATFDQIPRKNAMGLLRQLAAPSSARPVLV
jgi:hypothetical protein